MPFLILFLITLNLNAAVTFRAVYSVGADRFQFLDCASLWWSDFCGDDGTYQKELEIKSKLQKVDTDLFKKYQEIREKYYQDEDQKEKDPLKNRNGFFAKIGSLNADPIAVAFYSSKTTKQAIESLSQLTGDEKKFLTQFYDHFKVRLEPYLKESQAFPQAAKDLNKKLQKKEYETFFKTIQQFYGVKADINYTVLFVWWPPLNRDYAYPVSDFLILSKNPVKHLGWSDEEIVFHEVVHTISMRQDLEKKQEFTKIFLEECPSAINESKGTILEEPLAVALGQMLFLKKFFPKKYTAETNWYNNAWINKFSIAIFPTIEEAMAKKQPLNEELVKKLGKICQKSRK